MRPAASRTVPARMMQIFGGTTTSVDADAACVLPRSNAWDLFNLAPQ
jgi:hypothetical protein